MSDKSDFFCGKSYEQCITKLILSSKCKMCFGNGIKYIKGDFYTCKRCRGGGKEIIN